MTPAERAVIAAAIRWNEIHDASNEPDRALCDAVERLVDTEDPKRWAEVLAGYEASPVVPTVHITGGPVNRCKQSRVEGKHLVTCNRIAGGQFNGGEIDGKPSCLACLRDRAKAVGGVK